ncbi:MAG: hypothetical protein P1V18_00690 [Candidatus Gracilibacteria bacterium]|nr:hypothetical protein [Candidatus Gracilibacteria bacterium]
MKISEIAVVPIREKIDGHCAMVSFLLDKTFFMGSIALYRRPDGSFRLVFPTKKIGNTHLNIYHPITKQATQKIEAAVFPYAEKLLNKN